MSKVALNIRGLSPLEKVARAKQIIDALTGNADFPTPQPTLASITAAHVALDTAFTDAQTAKRTSKSLGIFTKRRLGRSGFLVVSLLTRAPIVATLNDIYRDGGYDNDSTDDMLATGQNQYLSTWMEVVRRFRRS